MMSINWSSYFAWPSRPRKYVFLLKDSEVILKLSLYRKWPASSWWTATRECGGNAATRWAAEYRHAVSWCEGKNRAPAEAVRRYFAMKVTASLTVYALAMSAGLSLKCHQRHLIKPVVSGTLTANNYSSISQSSGEVSCHIDDALAHGGVAYWGWSRK